MQAPKTIVLADDDRLICEAIGDELRSKGYRVHVVHDGEAALAAARQLRPDVLILDIVMPKLTGAQVSRLVRQEPHLDGVKLVALSAVGTLDFRWFSELSADFFVAKKTLPETCRNLLLAIELVSSKSRDAFGRRLLGPEVAGARGAGGMIGVQPRLAGLIEPLADACGRGCLELDRRGDIALATSLACEALGQEEAALLGRSFSSLCSSGDQGLIQGLIDAASNSTSGQRFSAVITVAARRLQVQLLGLRAPGIDTLVAVVTRWDELPASSEQPASQRAAELASTVRVGAPSDQDAQVVLRDGVPEPLRQVGQGLGLYRVRLSALPRPAWAAAFEQLVELALLRSAVRLQRDIVLFEADPHNLDDWLHRIDSWIQSTNARRRPGPAPDTVAH